MKLAFATTFDARDVRHWSGAPYFMARNLEQQAFDIEYLGPLASQKPWSFKMKRLWKKICVNERETIRYYRPVLDNYADQLKHKLQVSNADAVFAPLIDPIAYLDTNKPIIFWTDAVAEAFIGFYSSYETYSASAQQTIRDMTRACLSRMALGIFSSDWAARFVIERYGLSPERVKVVPYGANIEQPLQAHEIRELLRTKDNRVVKLLFVGVDWKRKGGDTVIAVAKKLEELGYPAEINVVGCVAPVGESLPASIKFLGFISKKTAEGRERLQQLFYQSHFFIMPSRAETFGIALCEANACGLPVMTTRVGGITTIVRDEINGKAFYLDAGVEEYCEFIIGTMEDRKRYEELVLSSFNEFETRLNWRVGSQTVKKLIKEVV